MYIYIYTYACSICIYKYTCKYMNYLDIYVYVHT